MENDACNWTSAGSPGTSSLSLMNGDSDAPGGGRPPRTPAAARWLQAHPRNRRSCQTRAGERCANVLTDLYPGPWALLPPQSTLVERFVEKSARALRPLRPGSTAAKSRPRNSRPEPIYNCLQFASWRAEGRPWSRPLGHPGDWRSCRTAKELCSSVDPETGMVEGGGEMGRRRAVKIYERK